MENIEAGKYQATPVSWGVTLTKGGKEQAVIKFELLVNEKPVTMNWYGSFNEGKAREITLKAIAACGCKDIANFDAADGLDKTKQVSVTVEKETNEKGTFSKIKWVNAPQSNKFDNLVPPAKSKSFLKSMKADYAAVKQEMPKNDAPKLDETEEIGF